MSGQSAACLPAWKSSRRSARNAAHSRADTSRALSPVARSCPWALRLTSTSSGSRCSPRPWWPYHSRPFPSSTRRPRRDAIRPFRTSLARYLTPVRETGGGCPWCSTVQVSSPISTRKSRNAAILRYSASAWRTWSQARTRSSVTSSWRSTSCPVIKRGKASRPYRQAVRFSSKTNADSTRGLELRSSAAQSIRAYGATGCSHSSSLSSRAVLPDPCGPVNTRTGCRRLRAAPSRCGRLRNSLVSSTAPARPYSWPISAGMRPPYYRGNRILLRNDRYFRIG